MVINPNLPPVNSQFTKTSPTKPAAQTTEDSANAARNLNATDLPELQNPDEVNLIMDLAKHGILGQSNLALAAQGNLSPETVFSLVQP